MLGVRLVAPTGRYYNSFKHGFAETRGQEALKSLPLSASSYLKHIEDVKCGLGFPVPYSEYWLVNEKRFLGLIQIRHLPHASSQFSDKMKSHIYFDIRPTERSRGYGRKILSLGLHKARQLGLNYVLLSYQRINRASQSIIREHGGFLVQSEVRPNDTPPVELYRIDLSPREYRAN